ncbi:pyridoxal phosphate-dependent decarboxylase family protein [Haliangium sp.]|uniref:pyridoxal phosphate-dependent decarboxylase family protein n=1 Tax=Haliangium sp. TaxID=2663208 RepID=UPI003D0C7E7B
MSKHRQDYRGRAFEALLRSVQRYAHSAKAPRLGRKSTSTGGSLLGDEPGNTEVAAWFLGPRAENAQLFEQLVVEALRDHAFWRRNFHPSDPPAISERMKRDPGYLESLDTLNAEFDRLLAELKKSAPFFSPRYQGHMVWDQTLPGIIGYFAGMLYNQNNVSLEASPVTTVLELEAARDLYTMLGYRSSGTIKPWGHLTCGGSTANLEALWAARNLTFYPLALRHALREEATLAGARELTVTLPSGATGGRLVDLDTWQALNLGVDEILGLSTRIEAEFGISPDTVTEAVSPYSLQNLGFPAFVRRFLDGVPEPVIIAPGSKHYSLTKGAALLGVGADHIYRAPLDVEGRVDMGWVEQLLDTCVADKRPVIAVVAIVGTTEEGTVDDIATLLDLRDRKYRAQEVEFMVHADAAWGGYFAALLRDGDESEPEPEPHAAQTKPVLPLSSYSTRQYENLHRADTITVDPHKTGYLPYPAGALCYRNGALRSLVAFDAPYINPDVDHRSLVIGSYGVEGSKPGAAAAGVYLSHAVIRPNRSGYGKILARALYNTKLFHYRLLQMNQREQDFVVVPTPRLGLDGAFADCDSEEEGMARLHDALGDKSHAEILNSDGAMSHLRELSADLNILTYAFNFRRDGVLNRDLAAANGFNKRIYERVGVRADGRQIQDYQVILSTTDFKKDSYGATFFNDYKRRLLELEQEVDDPTEDSLTVMRSVIMDPWLTEGAGGTSFMDTIIDELGAVVRQVLAEMPPA